MTTPPTMTQFLNEGRSLFMPTFRARIGKTIMGDGLVLVQQREDTPGSEGIWTIEVSVEEAEEFYNSMIYNFFRAAA